MIWNLQNDSIRKYNAPWFCYCQAKTEKTARSEEKLESNNNDKKYLYKQYYKNME